MRQFTDSEREARNKGWLDHLATANPITSPDFDTFESGFITAAEYTDTQLAALTAERDTLSGALRGLRELERLAIDVADYIRDTSWSMGPIRKLVEYIDNKDKDNERPN